MVYSTITGVNSLLPYHLPPRIINDCPQSYLGSRVHDVWARQQTIFSTASLDTYSDRGPKGLPNISSRLLVRNVTFLGTPSNDIKM